MNIIGFITVEEMLNELKKYPPDMPVQVDSYGSGYKIKDIRPVIKGNRLSIWVEEVVKFR